MTTFYICRHGQTENNKNKRLSGWIDTPLTDEGVANAVSAAVKLQGVEFDRVVSSDLGRAFRTAYIITREIGSDLEIEATAALREVNYGDLANTSYVGPDIAYPKLTPEENTNYVAPNGESLAEMQARVMAYVQNLAQENADKTILIAAHDGTINAIYAAYTNRDLGVVDAESNNAHDFVAKFAVEGSGIVAFEEVRSCS